MTKASDLFIQCLEEEGVEYVSGVPGEENLDFLDSLSRSSKIRLILTRHEQGAGFMAATYGRHTGKTGVCLATRVSMRSAPKLLPFLLSLSLCLARLRETLTMKPKDLRPSSFAQS